MVRRCFQIEFSLILGVRLSSAWLDLSNVFEEEFSLTLFPPPLIAHTLRSGMFRPASLIEGSWRIPTAVLGSQLVCMFGWSRQGLFSPVWKVCNSNRDKQMLLQIRLVCFSCPLTILWISTPNNYLNNWYIVIVIGHNKIHVKHSHFNSYCMNFNNSNAEINLPILPNLSRAVCTTLSPSSTESAKKKNENENECSHKSQIMSSWCHPWVSSSTSTIAWPKNINLFLNILPYTHTQELKHINYPHTQTHTHTFICTVNRGDFGPASQNHQKVARHGFLIKGRF